MSDERDVRSKIDAGAYENRTPYPAENRKPDLLSKRAEHLTAADLADLPHARLQWERAKVAYTQAHQARREEEARLTEQFRLDVFAENNVPPNDPFGQAMYAVAWDRGHANGLSEVLHAFEDLLPLWTLYANKVPPPTK